MTKSHVGTGYMVCPVCGEKHDEVVLLDRRLKDSLEPESALGWALCPAHARMKDEYVALVEVEEEPSGVNPLATAKRTGQIAHVRRIAYTKLFKGALPPDVMSFVGIGVIQKLQGLMPAEEQATTTTQQLQTDVQNAEAEAASFETRESDGAPTGEPSA